MKETLTGFPLTAEMARAVSEARDNKYKNKYKKEWQRIADEFLSSCYKEIKKVCSKGEFQQNRVTINYSAEEPYRYAANEARKELIKMGFKVTGDCRSCGGHLFIYW